MNICQLAAATADDTLTPCNHFQWKSCASQI
jgi:hypothetical protein